MDHCYYEPLLCKGTDKGINPKLSTHPFAAHFYEWSLCYSKASLFSRKNSSSKAFLLNSFWIPMHCTSSRIIYLAVSGTPDGSKIRWHNHSQKCYLRLAGSNSMNDIGITRASGNTSILLPGHPIFFCTADVQTFLNNRIHLWTDTHHICWFI